MKKISIFGLAVIGFSVLMCLPIPVGAMTGSGTVGDPFVIWNVTDLQDMSSDLTAYYELGCDIDATNTTNWNWDAGRGVYEGFMSVGAFAGHFDGNYQVIDGLYMDRYENAHLSAGLFSGFDGVAYVQNVYIVNANITARSIGDNHRCNAGVLAGSSGSSSEIHISNVITSGTVDATQTDGGGTRLVPGAGGLIGFVYEGDGVIEECAAYVDVTYNALSEAISAAGGFVGNLGTYYGSYYEIKNCYARGDVLATRENYPAAYAGGFCGERSGSSSAIKMTNCYSTGVVSSTEAADDGGFCGAGGGAYNCFWDIETSGQATSSGGTGKTTAEMKTQSTFTDAGWDFDTIWDIGGAINDGYPYLEWWYTPANLMEDINQVLWFQPNAIISGTTLPDRAGTEDGIITWGANPAGISITIDGFIPEYQLPMYVLPADIVEPPLDMVGPTGQPGWTSDIPSLTGHPFYPIVAMIGNQTGIPIKLVWVILATLLLLIAMMLCYRYAPHQLITVIVGGSICAFWYHMEIYPFWVIFIFVVMGVAIIIGERSPTVS